MDIQVIHPEELTSQQINIWSGMMTSGNATDSPFFHPEYVITLSHFRKPVRVAIIRENGQIIAFFPFEQHGRIGLPLGIKLSDFQGIVRSSENVIDARELLAGCDLTTWKFDHVVASHPEFQDWHLRTEDSLYMDISRGFDTYVAQRKQAGSGLISQINQKQRKLEREIGPVRFAWHSSDDDVFQTLLEWKSAQRKRTNTFDILQFDWVTKALDSIRGINSEGFSGVLSTLHVQDKLAAVHLGMRTKTVLYYWFPAYDQNLSKYSPGLIFHLTFTQAAAERGIKRLDLGKGNERFKKSLASGSIPVAEGAVELNPLRHMTRSFWYRTCERIRSSRLYGPVQIPKRIIRNFIRKREMNSS